MAKILHHKIYEHGKQVIVVELASKERFIFPSTFSDDNYYIASDISFLPTRKTPCELELLFDAPTHVFHIYNAGDRVLIPLDKRLTTNK